MQLNSLEQARRIAGIAQDKLADDVVILDMRPVCVFTDFFVIATGRNARQTKAIWDEIHERMKQEERPMQDRGSEGRRPRDPLLLMPPLGDGSPEAHVRAG